jgi:hypothetical protein
MLRFVEWGTYSSVNFEKKNRKKNFENKCDCFFKEEKCYY